MPLPFCLLSRGRGPEEEADDLAAAVEHDPPGPLARLEEQRDVHRGELVVDPVAERLAHALVAADLGHRVGPAAAQAARVDLLAAALLEGLPYLVPAALDEV